MGCGISGSYSHMHMALLIAVDDAAVSVHLQTVTVSYILNCNLMLAAGNVTCAVELRNSGNVRLINLGVTGDVNDCIFAGPVWPAQSVFCNITR
jgi:hypothetical protein